jgi:TRAP-type transport system periplasmic protein
MIKFRLLSAVLAASAAMLFSPAQAQTTLRLAHHHAVGGTVDLTANKFADLVKERSKGQLLIRVFPAAQLGQEKEAFGLVNTGVIDLSCTSLGILEQAYPASNVTSLPFVFRDWAHIYKLYNGEFGAAMKDDMKKQTNSEILGYIHLGFRDMLFRGAPVKDVAGMKGLKMRSPEATIWIRMFELLGAKPTPVTWGEVYTAMQAGVADGLESPAQIALDTKFNEVAKSVVRTRHMFASMAIIGNKAKLEKLPKDQQDMLAAAATEAANWSNTTITEPGEEAAYKKMTSLGMQVVEPTNGAEWASAVRPMWGELTAKTPGSDRLLKMIVETK